MSDRTATAARSRSSAVVFVGVSVGNFLVLLDTSILNVALPDVQADLGASAGQLPWAATAYTITFAGLLLAAGAISDRVGSVRLYRWSLIGFAVLSLCCAAAPSMAALIGGRALLGVAAACLVPSSVALLAGQYADPRERAKAIGLWAALTSSGLLLGPILGGILVELGGWRWIFLVNPPIALVAMWLVHRLVNAPAARARAVDGPGIVLSVLTLTSLTLGLIEGGTGGWSRPLPWVILAVSAVLGVGLAVAERRAAFPVIPPQLMSRPDLRGSIVAAAVATLVFYGVLYAVTLWLQFERDLTPLQAGLTFIPMTLPMCVLPIFTGRMVAARGARRVILGGLMFDVLAGLLLIMVAGDSSLAWIVPAEIALVLACTTVIPAATADIAVHAPADVAGAAQGVLNAGRQAGSALGVAILGPLTSLPQIGGVMAVLSVLTVLLVVIGRPRSVGAGA